MDDANGRQMPGTIGVKSYILRLDLPPLDTSISYRRTDLPALPAALRRPMTTTMTVRRSCVIRPPACRPGAAVTAFDGALRELATDLADTMHAALGSASPAPHIGITLRVVVLDLDASAGARTYVNPEITWASPRRSCTGKAASRCPGP